MMAFYSPQNDSVSDWRSCLDPPHSRHVAPNRPLLLLCTRSNLKLLFCCCCFINRLFWCILFQSATVMKLFVVFSQHLHPQSPGGWLCFKHLLFDVRCLLFPCFWGNMKIFDNKPSCFSLYTEDLALPCGKIKFDLMIIIVNSRLTI